MSNLKICLLKNLCKRKLNNVQSMAQKKILSSSPIPSCNPLYRANITAKPETTKPESALIAFVIVESPSSSEQKRFTLSWCSWYWVLASHYFPPPT